MRFQAYGTATAPPEPDITIPLRVATYPYHLYYKIVLGWEYANILERLMLLEAHYRDHSTNRTYNATLYHATPYLTTPHHTVVAQDSVLESEVGLSGLLH